MLEIFISYRRSDSAGHARALYRDLCRRFSDENIFFDRSSIESGDIFPDRLEKGVSGCKVLLALIGPDWLEVKNAAGQRRLEDPNDFVRQEIARSIELGKKIIPILFDDTPMPPPDRLPEPLKHIVHYDALTFRGKTYEYDRQLEELIQLLAKVPGVPKPKPAEKGVLDKFIRFAEDLLSDHFTGRTRELNSVSEALPMDGSILRTAPVVLYGMGGGGKTQIALKCIDGHQEDYTGIPVFEYLDMLASVDTAGILLEEGRPVTGYERNIVAALSLSIERLSPAALQLFRIFACMSPDPIPLNPLHQHFESFPAELREAARQPIDWHKTVGELVRYSLAQRLQVVSREKIIGDGLQFHRLTQQVALARFVGPGDKQAAWKLLVAALPEKLDDPAVWPNGLSLLPHLQSLALLSKNEETHAELAVDSLNRGVVLAFHTGLPTQGELLALSAHQIGLRFLGEEHRDTLKSMNNCAATLRGQGDLSAVRKLHEQVLEIRRRTLGEEHPDTATSYG